MAATAIGATICAAGRGRPLSEPPFLIAQTVVLAIFIWLCVKAVKRFKPTAA